MVKIDNALFYYSNNAYGNSEYVYPIVYSYGRFSASRIRTAFRQVDVTEKGFDFLDMMMTSGLKRVGKRGNNVVSEDYIAGGEAFGEGPNGGGEYMVFILTNSNQDIIDWYAASGEELGGDVFERRHKLDMPEQMTDADWGMIMGFFQSIITVSTTGDTTTIDYNGGNIIRVNNSDNIVHIDQPLNYYKDLQGSEWAEEKQILEDNGWLTDGVYEDIDSSVYTALYASLVSKADEGLDFTHDEAAQEIIISSGGRTLLVMQDRNIGATTYWKFGDELTTDNCGDFYCWGGKTPFVTLPTNADEEDWTVTQTIAPAGYHIPTSDERKNVLDLWWSRNKSEVFDERNNLKSSTAMEELLDKTLKLPFAGYRTSSNASVSSQGSYGYYWSSSPYSASSSYARNLLLSSSNVGASSSHSRAYGFSVRCFKNSYTS